MCIVRVRHNRRELFAPFEDDGVAVRLRAPALDAGHVDGRRLLIAEVEISRTATLLPGDLIMTGTPSGVGQAREPRLRLVAGDTVAVTIESVGTLSNSVREI